MSWAGEAQSLEVVRGRPISSHGGTGFGCRRQSSAEAVLCRMEAEEI